MRLIYLDQNKWIDLGKAVDNPSAFPLEFDVLTKLVAGRQSGDLAIPLSDTNLFETYKIGQPERRAQLAYVQSTLSGGLFLRGRRRRLSEELRCFWRENLSHPIPVPEERWFTSNLFIEATMDIDDPRLSSKPSSAVLEMMRRYPQRTLFEYLTVSTDEMRRTAVEAFTRGADELLNQIERRRQLSSSETLAMRRRIYSANLLLNEIDFIFSEARAAGVPWKSLADIRSASTRKLMTDIPTFFIERELAIRIEDQNRKVTENDLRDMTSFVAALRYADIIVAENQFTNLSIQGDLESGTERKC